MAFKLQSELTFPWPVKVMEPDPNKPGKFLLQEFQVMFKILPPERIKASAESRRSILAKSTPETSIDELKLIQIELDAHDLETLQEVVVGWSGIVGDDDKPLAFTDKMFRAAYQVERVRVGLVLAYQEAISQDRARLGN